MGAATVLNSAASLTSEPFDQALILGNGGDDLGRDVETRGILRALLRYLLLFQKGQGVSQECHPEGARCDLRGHQRQEQRSRVSEALVPIDSVELTVLS